LLFSTPSPEAIEFEEPEAVAEQIIAAARAKAAGIEQQAVENGRALIQAEVQAEVASLIGPWQEQLTNTLAELDDLRAGITAQAERDLVRLALEIARKVVHREVSIDKEIVMTLARIGLTRGHSRTPATIHLHPDDFAYVNLHRERLVSGQTLELVEDRSIMRGGCLVRTEMGDVDARIDQQFIEIERAFLEA
jgi:flagellar assembly protein FliH